ncbi:MAG: hypothetical protein L3J46_06085 [Kangiellaceae bacterium]|nr:hypothetical protein [Kangiellaceae bacterium]
MKTRPKRIWAISLMLIIIPSMSLFLSSYLLITGKMPEELEITIYNLLNMYMIPLGLIISSVMLFLGMPNSQRYVLSLSIAYFGMLIYQNAYLLTLAELPSEATTKVTANIVRSIIEILLVAWVAFSAKTKTFLSRNV